jgi:hypothetical protein
MTDEHEHDEAQDLEDLEVTDADTTDAVKGGAVDAFMPFSATPKPPENPTETVTF